MKISIVLPVYNESENLNILYEEIKKVCGGLNFDYEMIFINDGSRDDSLIKLKELAIKDNQVKVIDFKNNFGQTAAMSAGISSSTGDIIIPMDSDLQNDPADIQKFLDKIRDGYDVVSGWRQNRWQNYFITRKLPSVAANWLISYLTGVKLHDYGCTMKAYKRDIIQGVSLYGEMHRFIPAYTAWNGGKVTEITVNCRPRLHGQTNYTITRTFKVLLDLVVVKFLAKYMDRPIHFFGGLGFTSLFLGFLAGLAAVLLRIFHIKYIVDTPLPIFSALLIIVGVQLIVMGIIAEMIMRTYYESQGKKPYVIKEKINFN